MFSKFYVKLKHSSTETIWMIQKAAARSSWWLAASSQHTRSCITSHCRDFWPNIKSPSDSAPLQPRFVTLCLLPFPKTKITLKGKRFHTVNEIWENTTQQLMAIPTKDFAVLWTVEEMLGELCEVPSCLLWSALRRHCLMYNVSCILYVLQ